MKKPDAEFEEARRYREDELDAMDQIRIPRLNPWLTMLILLLIGFAYLWLWGALLRVYR